MKERVWEYKGLREVYGQTLVELGEKNPDIVVLDADLSSSTKTAMFGKKFPDRFFNMGISEQDMMGTAAGLAAGGKVAFASTFAIFATGRAWEQIRQSICYPGLNVKIIATHGGITVGEDGATHQCIEDFGLMRVLSGMKVIVPADPVETKRVIETVATEDGPFYVRLSRVKFPVLYSDKYEFKVGKSDILREGKDITLMGIGLTVSHCILAADILASHGIEARVINMSTLSPIDSDAVIAAAKETKRIVTVEEHLKVGGLGSAVSECLSENYPTLLKIMGITEFGISGKAEKLLEYFKLMPGDIAEAALNLLKKEENI
ncbi:MAG: transketolase family protein [Thermodesulfobacteriota bacterium]|nr:transketolase family protein [Thermodesulfobacteriota bacterium]